VQVILTEDQKTGLQEALAAEPRVRHWRRYQAIWLLGQDDDPIKVAAALGCSLASVYNWALSWHRSGVGGLKEAKHQGRVRSLDGSAEAELESLLTQDPQERGYHASGWTILLLQQELGKVGYQVSGKTIRRTLHRLGWRWKRPKYVLERPDPEYQAKKGW
jgi:transposase